MYKRFNALCVFKELGRDGWVFLYGGHQVCKSTKPQPTESRPEFKQRESLQGQVKQQIRSRKLPRSRKCTRSEGISDAKIPHAVLYGNTLRQDFTSLEAIIISSCRTTVR